KAFIQKNPVVAYPVIGLAVLLVWTLLMVGSNHRDEQTVNRQKNSNVGFSIGAVEQQAYSQRLEKNYYDFEARVKSVEQQMESMKTIAKDIRKQQKDMRKAISQLDQKWSGQLQERLGQGQEGGPNAEAESLELAIADINPL